jgi:hypothetical protein
VSARGKSDPRARGGREVSDDRLQGSRFRDAPHFLRWRPDRTPRSYIDDQLQALVPVELKTLFAG